MNLSIINSCGKLVDIWQVQETLDEVIDKPRCVLHAILNVFFPLLVTSHFLVATSRTCHQSVLIWHIVWVVRLKLVVLGEKELYVPGKDSTLSSAREKKLLIFTLNIAETVLSAGYVQRSQEPILAILEVIEANGEITETNSNGILL